MGIENKVIRTNSSVTQYSANEAQKIVGQLSRLIAKIQGPLLAKRRLLMEVGNSIMLYGTEIWAEVLDVKKWANSVASVQGKAVFVQCPPQLYLR